MALPLLLLLSSSPSLLLFSWSRDSVLFFSSSPFSRFVKYAFFRTQVRWDVESMAWVYCYTILRAPLPFIFCRLWHCCCKSNTNRFISLVDRWNMFVLQSNIKLSRSTSTTDSIRLSSPSNARRNRGTANKQLSRDIFNNEHELEIYFIFCQGWVHRSASEAQAIAMSSIKPQIYHSNMRRCMREEHSHDTSIRRWRQRWRKVCAHRKSSTEISRKQTSC